MNWFNEIMKVLFPVERLRTVRFRRLHPHTGKPRWPWLPRS